MPGDATGEGFKLTVPESRRTQEIEALAEADFVEADQVPSGCDDDDDVVYLGRLQIKSNYPPLRKPPHHVPDIHLFHIPPHAPLHD